MSILWYPELAAELARRDITHATLADHVGCVPKTISHVVRGRLAPSPDLRQRIADFLEVDEAELFAENPALSNLTTSRTDQGLEPTITDRATLRRIATIGAQRV